MAAHPPGRHKLRVTNSKWCIKSIHDDQPLFFADGAPRKVEFDIELTHYG
jgi:phage protein U